MPWAGYGWPAALVIGGFFVFLFSLEPGRDEVQAQQARKRPEAHQRAQQSSKPQAHSRSRSSPSTTSTPCARVRGHSAAASPADRRARPPKQTGQPEEAARSTRPAPKPRSTARPRHRRRSVGAKAPATTQFFLQAGSFRKREDADKVRAQIILLGQNVQVESGKVRRRPGTAYCVGPYASREQLASAQKAAGRRWLRQLFCSSVRAA